MAIEGCLLGIGKRCPMPPEGEWCRICGLYLPNIKRGAREGWQPPLDLFARGGESG
ncbi:MAG: hypothetical protein ACQXXL_03455 [Candidatus Methanosuratincola sp.]